MSRVTRNGVFSGQGYDAESGRGLMHHPPSMKSAEWVR